MRVMIYSGGRLDWDGRWGWVMYRLYVALGYGADSIIWDLNVGSRGALYEVYIWGDINTVIVGDVCS